MGLKAFIPIDRLHEVLDSLSRKIDLWVPAPVRDDLHATEFFRYRPGMTIVLDRQTTLPPKKLLLPQVETLLRFDVRKDPEDPGRHAIQLEEPVDARPVLVFGCRPCDVRGFETFDRTFLDGPHVDPYYRKRRENTRFATLVCREADGACFCSSVGGGPADMEGSDLRITPIEGGYCVESLSSGGDPFLEGLGVAPDARQEALAQEALEAASLQRVGDVSLEGCAEAFLRRFQDMDYWREMVGPCLSCGVCTYVCPTCYCFTITDESKDLRGERLRSWDSCMFFQYTLEASGHNPRPTKYERYRNRAGHKFSYIPARYKGLIGCCGCGRCIRSCPVSIDIRQVAGRLGEDVCVCA